MSKPVTVILVLLLLFAIVLPIVLCSSSGGGGGGGGGTDLGDPEWDMYFGCLEIQDDWGLTKSEAREVCAPYRP